MDRVSINNRQGRYEIREILAEGGMGKVYLAYDTVLKREVTLKTVRDVQDKLILDLFRRECAVLAQMAHPNIVEIFDIGETDEKEPFFVMPFLRGETLDQLIRSSSPRLTVERSIQMISQVCRGLQAAHDQGMIHRDLKPGNLFVLEDDSVKIIDFGVAHFTDQRSATGLKGTLLYMSPEQMQLRKLEPWSDQFTLAVITYETLTRRHPFASAGRDDLAQAIIYYSPPPASEINNLIPPMVSQVIHKALAKEPFHRFSSVREYSDCLLRAMRGEEIEIFNPARIEPRLIRARKAFEEGDLDFAAEITRELKSESYLSPEIDKLDKEIVDTIRAKNTKQLLETARRRFAEEEYVLALQKLQEVFNLDPENTDAQTLKVAIEGKRGIAQIEEWYRLAQQHVENNAYSHARQALEKVLEMRPKDIRAEGLLSEVNRREQEFNRLRSAKQQAYHAALESYERGDVKSALSKLEQVLELDRRAPHITSPEQTPAYQQLYEKVRSEHEHLRSLADEARKRISESNFQAAFAICDEALSKHPQDIIFVALRSNAEQGQRQEISAYVANVENEAGKEPDLNRRVAILEGAKAKYPAESRFEQALHQARSRKDLVDSIVGRAHSFEDNEHFTDALAQWEILREIHPAYPALEVEIERLRRRREEQIRSAAKAGWVAQIDQALGVQNHDKGLSLIAEALLEYPGDEELLALEKSSKQFLERQKEAGRKLVQGNALDASGHTEEALALLREAFKIDPHSSAIRNGLLELLLKQVRTLLDSNWKDAEPFLKEAVDLEPGNPLAKSLRTLIQDKKQSEDVVHFLSKIREFQGANQINEAIAELDKGLAIYPQESRLLQLRSVLAQNLSTDDRNVLRIRDLEGLKQLERESQKQTDPRQMKTILERTRVYSKYDNDPEFTTPLHSIEQRYQEQQKESPPPAEFPEEESVANNLEVQGDSHSSLELAPTPAFDMRHATPKNTKFLAIGVGAALLTLLPLLLLMFNKKRETNQFPTIQPVQVKIANAGDTIRVEDSYGAEVTAVLESPGLIPGTYKLMATRVGYLPIDLSIILKSGEASQSVDFKWVRLATQFVIRHATPNSAIQIGDRKEQVDAKGNLAIVLNPGAYSISYNSPVVQAGFTVELTLADGKVSIATWVRKPNFSILVTRLDASSVDYEAFAGIQGVMYEGAAYPATGKLPVLSREKLFVIHNQQTALLAEFHPLGNKFSSAIYFDLMLPTAPVQPIVREPSVKEPARPVTATPVLPPPPISNDRKPTAEELAEKRKLEDLQRELDRRSGSGKK